MTPKRLAGFRLTPETLAAIKALAAKLGVSQADIVEMAVRAFAKKQRREGL